MSVIMPSSDQVFGETAWHLRELTEDPEYRGDDRIASSLERTLVTAESTMCSVTATMSLSLQLTNLRLPADLARSFAYCQHVSEAVGTVLTELHRFCAAVRSDVLTAAGETPRA